MKPLTDTEIEKALQNLEGWVYEDGRIGKTIEFVDFRQAMAFMVRVAFAAEEQGHHPEWYNVYKTVAIQLSTHDADGKVTEKDIKLAKSIDQILAT